MVLDLEFSNDGGQFIVNLCFSNFQCLQIQVPSKLISAFQRSNSWHFPDDDLVRSSGGRTLSISSKGLEVRRGRGNKMEPVRSNRGPAQRWLQNYLLMKWGMVGKSWKRTQEILDQRGLREGFFSVLFGVLFSVFFWFLCNPMSTTSMQRQVPLGCLIAQASQKRLRDSICINFFSL